MSSGSGSSRRPSGSPSGSCRALRARSETTGPTAPRGRSCRPWCRCARSSRPDSSPPSGHRMSPCPRSTCRDTDSPMLHECPSPPVSSPCPAPHCPRRPGDDRRTPAAKSLRSAGQSDQGSPVPTDRSGSSPVGLWRLRAALRYDRGHVSGRVPRAASEKRPLHPAAPLHRAWEPALASGVPRLVAGSGTATR